MQGDEMALAAAAAQPRVSGALRTPLYHQIYLILRQKIVDGIYPFDGRLPGEQDLVEIYGVSRITAKRALDELAAEGLVVRERGRGTRVRYRAPAAPLRSSVEGLLENLLAMGLETEVKLVEFDYVAASEPVAVALECGPGELVQRALRVRMIDGQPFSHLTTYVPEDIGRQFDAADLSETALLALLERSGVEVSSATQTITATLADASAATHLEVDIGAALLMVSRIVRDQSGRPIEFITALYRPDRYQYRMILSRVHGKDRNVWETSGDGTGDRQSDAGMPSPRNS